MTAFRIVAAALAMSVNPCAEALDGQFSGQLKAVSDYVFRGIDRTDGPAAQGELDYVASNGLYAGAWASNAEAVGGSEVDVYAGYGRSLTVHEVYPLHLDGGLIGYVYPGDAPDRGERRALDFLETCGSARLGPATLKIYLSPDYENAGGVGAAFNGRLRWPLLARLGIRIDGTLNFGPGLRKYTARLTKDAHGRSYFDYAARLEYSLPANFNLAAGLAGTTLDIADGHGRDGNQPRWLLELGKRFDF